MIYRKGAKKVKPKSSHSKEKMFFLFSLLLLFLLHPYETMALVVKNLPANAGDVKAVGSIPGSGRSPGGGHCNPLQHCLGNPMARGAWRTTVHRVTNRRTWLKWLSTHKTVHVSWTYCENHFTIYVNQTIMLCTLKSDCCAHSWVIYVNYFSIKLEKMTTILQACAEK